MLAVRFIMLQLFDKNGNYWLEFEKAEWHNGDGLENVICAELRGTDKLQKEDEIPEETQFMMSLEDAEFLHSWLSVALKK